MSGYNQNWRRRDRDSRSSGGRGSQNNSNFWNSNHYGTYPQYVYSQQYCQQWSWGNPNQFQTFTQRPGRHVTFTPGQQHGKNGQSHRLPPPGSDSSKQRSASSMSQSKTPSDPHPGSEEARKKSLAQTADKVKSCLRSFQNEKSDVLENLLSGEETQSSTEVAKGSTIALEASGQELQLTPSDLKVIGMVSTPGLAVNERDSGIRIETGTVPKETRVANICEQGLNNQACMTDLLQNGSKVGKNKNAGSKQAVRSTSSSLEARISNKSNAGSEQSSSRAQSTSRREAVHPKNFIDKKQIDSAETLQKLKQLIIQEFLKMGKNNLKDVLNNPRSRKFEFAMNHLMKEHRKVLSRELRGLAQSRIKEQESQVQSHVVEASSLLDTDVAINLSHLPQELIEQLGNLLQLDLLDNAAVSEEFQPNMAVVEEESKYNVMQNIETLQVALMSEDSIKKENVEPQQIDTAVFTSQNTASETNAEEQSESMPPPKSSSDALETGQEQVATDDREIVHEEGNVINKTRKTSSDWCPYIPLGKGFMNRGDFDSLFCEFPDFMDTESAVSDEQDINLKDQSGACDESPSPELLENASVSNTRDIKADSGKETLEQNLMGEPETLIEETKEEENLRPPELHLPLNPFEDLQIPVIDAADKQVTAISREPSENGVSTAEDTRMQEVPPENAEGTGSHDDTTKSILDLEETLARVDESVAGMGDDVNKQTESEGIEFDITDAENPCDPNEVNDVLEGLRSIVENAKTVENVESTNDMKNSGTEADIVNKDICEREEVSRNMDVDVSAMSVEQCSDVPPEHNVDFVAERENPTLTSGESGVNLNPVISKYSEKVMAAGKEHTRQNNGLQLEDEVMELYRCNIVVKTEFPDTDVQQRNREEEPVQEMRQTTEIAIQTDSSELDPLDIEKFLRFLERAGQLSPQMTRLLKEQLSNKQVEMMEKDRPSLSPSVMFNRAASRHVRTSASRTSGNKGRTRKRSGISSHSEEILTEHQMDADSIQDLVSTRNAPGEIGSTSVNYASRNCMNLEDILPLPVRRESTAISKFVFLKMLEIDKEIQKLMEVKLDLYRKLQVTLEMDPSSVDGRGAASANSRNTEESGLSKETVGSPVPQMVPAEQSLKGQQMHNAAITVNDADAEETSHIGRKPLPPSSSNLAPMVMLPMDYMLSHQSSPSSRQKLKTLDTSVVEAVLNSFDIPEQSLKEKELTNTNSEEMPQSPSRNRLSSPVSTSEASVTSGSINKKPSVKQMANKKKNTAKKDTGKNKGAETVMSLENIDANEDRETTKPRHLRRRKPEEKGGGRNTRHKPNIVSSEEDDEPLSATRSLLETSNKLSNYDQEVETPMKIKSRRGSENAPDKGKNLRNKKEAEENASETSIAQCEESLQPKTTRNRRESRKTEVSAEEATELEEQEDRRNYRKAGEAEQVPVEAEEINKKSRGSKQRAILAINDTFSFEDSSGKNSHKRKVSLNESEQEDGSGAPVTRFRTRSPRKLTSDQESSQSETEITKKMRLHGGSEEPIGRRNTRTSLSESGRTNSHSEVVEETTEIKRHINLKRKAEEALGSPEKCQRLSKPNLKEAWNMPSCFVVVHPLAKEQIRSLNCTAPEIKYNEADDSDDDDDDDDNDPIIVLLKKEKKKTAKKRQSCKASIGTSVNVDMKENERDLFDLAEEKQEDPLGGIPDACQPPELHSESYISAVSTPLQSPPDLMVQTISPRTNISIQDENSISTLVSDSVSVNSDGEHSFVKKNDISGEYKDDYDQDSVHSCDTGQELRDGTGSRSLKHKSSKRHKKDIERLTFEAHQGPILDIKTVGRHVLAASEDGFVYCYSLKSGKFKRKYGGHDSAVTCLCVVECCVEPDVSNELEPGEQVTPELFFTGSLDKNLRYFSFKTGELVQPPVNIGSPIQCMDQNWGILFIGTKIGEVIQYNIKSSSIIGEEPLKLGREAILSLKATKEGPRNVLIIGSRNKPITIRDASSGLLLRSINSSWSHTVYSLVLNANEIYCGTKNGFIPVIQFQNGEQICRFRTGAGVICMRIYNNLLFAGCYDGNIYVFSIHDKKFVSCIPGPGKMLLCLDIVKNRIIVGSKDGNKLEAWGFPQDVRNHVKEAKHR